MKASVRIKVTQIQYHYSIYTFRSTLSKIFIVLKQKKIIPKWWLTNAMIAPTVAVVQWTYVCLPSRQLNSVCATHDSTVPRHDARLSCPCH